MIGRRAAGLFRWLRRIAISGLLGLSLVPGQAHAQAVKIIDQRGTPVSLPRPAQRVVSLLPSLTESICAMGACDRLVAVDRWSSWPESVKRLPSVGGLEDAHVELIVAQHPDLVVLAPSSRLTERLRGLGIRVAELDAPAMPDVQRVLTALGVLLARESAARQVWIDLQAQLRQAQQQVPVAAKGQRVYFEVGATPFAAGEASFIGQLLAQLGARNVVPASLGPFPQLNPEFVVQADPDLIMVSQGDAPTLAQRPGWVAMRAVRQQRLCAFTLPEMNVLVRPGPRLGEGAQVLARCLARFAVAKPVGR